MPIPLTAQNTSSLNTRAQEIAVVLSQAAKSTTDRIKIPLPQSQLACFVSFRIISSEASQPESDVKGRLKYVCICHHMKGFSVSCPELWTQADAQEETVHVLRLA